MRDFDHTINVLVKAYLDGTLVHGECAACAVGNIIADSLNCKVVPSEFDGHEWIRGKNVLTPIWDEVFVCDGIRKETLQTRIPKNYKGWAKRQIDSTGYSWKELAKIEKAFELQATYIVADDITEDEAMFNGLMAVVDVLAEIHGIDLKSKEEAKALFVKV